MARRRRVNAKEALRILESGVRIWTMIPMGIQMIFAMKVMMKVWQIWYRF